jgi:hypothetical protein
MGRVVSSIFLFLNIIQKPFDKNQDIKKKAKNMPVSNTSPPASLPGKYATFHLPPELRLMILRELMPDLSKTIPQNSLTTKNITIKRNCKMENRPLRKTTKFNALGALCLTSKTMRMEALEVYAEAASKFRLKIDIQGKLLDYQDYLDYHPLRDVDWFPLRLDIIPCFREVEISLRGCNPNQHKAIKKQLNVIYSLLQGEKVTKVRILWDAKYTAWKLSHGTLNHFIEVSRRMIEICPTENRKTGFNGPTPQTDRLVPAISECSSSS